MSTAIVQPNEGQWKQEVNRRLAAHRERRGVHAQPASPPPAYRHSDSRAAAAAARVAARFAQAPSYAQMQAAEARAALHEAEIATQVALEAQAKAQVALASLQQTASQPAASRPSEEEIWDTEPFCQSPVPADVIPSPDPYSSRSRYSMEEPRAFSAPEFQQSSTWTDAEPLEPAWADEPREAQEPLQTIAANLIEFPRQLVATRKMRPRLAEGPLASVEPERQLSIFEVDPSSVNTHPEPPAPVRPASQAWSEPEWSRVTLKKQPVPEAELDQPVAQQIPQQIEQQMAQPLRQPALDLASFGRRFQAAVVDGALLIGAGAGTLSLLISRMDSIPPVQTLETSSAMALGMAALLYHVFFGLMGLRTPGMVYARITASTYDGRRALPSQIRLRALALVLSILPAGLGVLWSLVDRNHLSWHDRLSGTFLRKA